MVMRFQSSLHTGMPGSVSQALASGRTRMRPYVAAATAALVASLLAGCGVTPGDFGERANKPLSPQLLADMQQKGMLPNSPILIRAFKKEAEVEIWKMKPDGHYGLFKSYPICRWSGQLGPKTREGDRQVPEGFYTITPTQMNPRSAYYLSFNVGYPNTYDEAHGYSGGEIMVHGVCSSAGCFSMTDQQIAEIYAVAREAFAGGEPAIQFQSFPFHMTPDNLAKYRLDPNIAFWKELKVGYDNFEVTKQEVAVGVCNSHYVFNAAPANGAFDPTGPCPPLKRDQAIALAVSAKQAADEAKAADLVAAGVRPVHTVYADGGQNAQFSQRPDIAHDVSRPDALAAGPVDMPLDQNHRYKPLTKAQLEAAKAKAEEAEKKAEAAHASAYADPAPAPPPQPNFAGITLPNLQAPPAAAQPAPPQPVVQAAAPPPQQWGFKFPGLVQQPLPAAQVAAQQAPNNPNPAPKPAAPSARTQLAQDAPPADTMWPQPAHPGLNIPGLPSQGTPQGTAPAGSPQGTASPPSGAPAPRQAPPADTMWPQPAHPGLNIPGIGPQAKPAPSQQPVQPAAAPAQIAATQSSASPPAATSANKTVASKTTSPASAQTASAADADAAKAAYEKPVPGASNPSLIPDFSSFSGGDK
jgi:murein L,D-transpeptidase YafK